MENILWLQCGFVTFLLSPYLITALSPSAKKRNVGLSNKTTCHDPEPESECCKGVNICRNLIWSRFAACVSAK